MTHTDGIFKDPYELWRFVGGKPGSAQSVKITRSGMVITEHSLHQEDREINP